MKYKCMGFKFIEDKHVVIGLRCRRTKKGKAVRIELEIPKRYRI